MSPILRPLSALIIAVCLAFSWFAAAQTHDDSESTYPEFYISVKGSTAGSTSLKVTFQGFDEWDANANAFVTYEESLTVTGSGTTWSTPTPLLVKKGMPLNVPGTLKLENANNIGEYKIFINVPDPKYQPHASAREQTLTTTGTPPVITSKPFLPIERRLLYWVKDSSLYGYSSSPLPHHYMLCFKRAGEAGELAGRASSAMPGWQNFKLSLGQGRTGRSLGYMTLWKGAEFHLVDSSQELTFDDYTLGSGGSAVTHSQIFTPATVVELWIDPTASDPSFGSTKAYRIKGFDRASQVPASASDSQGHAYLDYAGHTPVWEYSMAFVSTTTEWKTKLTRSEGSGTLESYAYRNYELAQPLVTSVCFPPVTMSFCTPGFGCMTFGPPAFCFPALLAPGSASVKSYSFDWATSGVGGDQIARSSHQTTPFDQNGTPIGNLKLSTAVGLSTRGTYSRAGNASGRLTVSSQFQTLGTTPQSHFWKKHELKDGITLDTETSQFSGDAEYYFDTPPITGGHLKLKHQKGPDGNWAYYEYYDDVDTRGMVKRVTRPHATTEDVVPPVAPAAQAPTTLVTDYAYTQDWDYSKTLPLEVITRQVDAGGTGPNDRVVSVVRYDYSASQFANPSAQPTYEGLLLHVAKKEEYYGPNSGDKLTSVVKRFRADTDRMFAGLPFLEERPDGTQDVWIYRAGQYDAQNRVFTLPSAFEGKQLGEILTSATDRAAAEFQTWKIKAYNPTVAGNGGVSGSVVLCYGSATTIASLQDSYVVPLKSTAEVTTRDKHGRVRKVETLLFTGKVGTACDWSSYQWALLNAEAHDYDSAGNIVASSEWVKTGSQWAWWKSYEARYTTISGENLLDYASISFDNSLGARTGRKQVERDRAGVIRRFYYDTYGRVEKTVELQPPSVGSLHRPPAQQTVFTFDADGRVLSTSVGTVTTGSTPDANALTSSREYNLAGLVTRETAVGGYVTTSDYANGGRTVTQTLKGNNDTAFSTVNKEKYLDGQPKSVSGTGTVPQFFKHAIESTGTTFTVGGASRKQAKIKRTESRGSATATTSRKAITEFDWLGRKTREELANASGVGNQVTTYQFDGLGRLWRSQVSSLTPVIDLAPVLYEYNAFGELEAWGIKLDSTQPNQLRYDSNDRINWQVTGFGFDSAGMAWEITDNYTFPDVGSAAPHWLKTTARKRTTEAYPGDTRYPALGGVGIDLREAGVIQTSVPGKSFASYSYVGRNKSLLVTEDVSSLTGNLDVAFSLNSKPVYSASAAGVVAEQHYDDYGRPWRTRSRVGDAETYYVSKTIQPEWQKSSDGIWVQTGYESTARIAWTKQYTTKSSTQPSGGAAGITTYFSYNARGQTTRVWGDNAYPTEYVYYESGNPAGYPAEVIGELYEQRTFNAGTGWTSSTWPTSPGNPNRTRFVYFAENGLLKEKQFATDAAGSTFQKTFYTYNQRRDLKTRVWNANNAAAITTYNYFEAAGENTGELKGVDYPAGSSTTDLSYKYNRIGTLCEVTDAAGTRTFTYRPEDLQMEAETLPSSLYGSGLKMTRTYDAAGRLNGFWHGTSASTPATWVNYGFEGLSGRVGTINAPVGQFTYGYLPNSDLIARAEVPAASTLLIHYRQHAANADTLTAWNTGLGSSESSLAALGNYAFMRDDRNRISKFGQTGRIYEPYGSGVSLALGYNDRNEVTGSTSYLTGDPNATGSATAVPRRNHVFNYDNAGNRSSTKVDTDTTLTYTPNPLGQYSGRQRAHHVEVSGLVGKNTSVTATRAGNSFSVTTTLTSPDYNFVHGLGTRPASSAAASEAVSVTATRTSPNATLNQTRNTLVPAIPASGQASETFAYDTDGNLTQDAFWTYRYDLENRIREIETLSTLPAGIPRVRVSFVYDYLSRRVKKTVETHNGSAWVVNNTRAFAYDGWNLIAEYTVSGSTLTLDRTYHWGLDLSGSIHGAGGIGGLLGLNVHGSTPQALLAVNDFNGNVVGLVDRFTGNLAAAYEYSPFGETLRASGPLAEANPLRFSSKYLDAETDLLNFGYRFYSAGLGRFVNRDPVNEIGRLQLNAPLMESSVAVWGYIGTQGGVPGRSPRLTPDVSLAKTSQPHTNDRGGGRRNSTIPGNVVRNRKGNGGGDFPGLFVAYAAPPVYGAENPYLYVANGPYAGVDPLGLDWSTSSWNPANWNWNPLNWTWGMSYSGETFSARLPRPGEDMSDVRFEYAQQNKTSGGMVFPNEWQEGKGDIKDVIYSTAQDIATLPLGKFDDLGRLTTLESRAARTANAAERAIQDAKPGFLSRMWDNIAGWFDRGNDAAKWTPHPGFQMPAADKGRFLGDVGNSAFELSDDAAAAMGVPRGTSIPWRNGIPDFGAHAVPGPGGISSEFSVPGLTGAHGADRTLMLQHMQSQSGMSQRALQQWLSANNVRLHHAGGEAVQIVPAGIHGLHHSGGAQQLRIGN